ncbi:MAG TPA: radical SAM protein [Longimicrobiaceae bacterium]|nr:radical SAM protein [Longimicrobiaceae bacterium]
MKILFIEPSYYTSSGLEKAALYKDSMRGAYYLSLTLPHLAALTPADIEVEIAFEVCEDLENDYDLASYDLIGITCQTVHFRRVLELAKRFRELGVPVVVGGPATIEDNHRLVPVLARFCTSVVVGEAEEVWPQFLDDFRSGTPKKVYRSGREAPVAGFPIPRFELVNFDYLAKPHVLPAMASRGCPRNCSFCSEFLYGRWRLRPVDEVVTELAAYKSRFGIPRVAFRDDDFMVHPRRSMELLEKIRDLEIEWSCQTDLNLSRHREVAEMAVRAGMKSVSFGLESIEVENLESARKRFFSIPEAEELLHFLHGNGVETQVNIIFGFDGDTPEVFDRTVDFVLRNRVSLFFPSILFPIPGTPVYEQLLKENRIIDLHPPGDLDPLVVNFIPKHLTAEQLVSGFLHAKERFYRERRDPVFWLEAENNIWGTTSAAGVAC